MYELSRNCGDIDVYIISGEPEAEREPQRAVDRPTPLANYLSSVARTQIKIGYSRNMTAELQRTRTASVDILVGPAHRMGR